MEGIFGRDLELAAMERFLDGAPTWPSAVVIEGEAGIGKTTLWLEGVRRAKERGMRALRAQPAESEQKLSYVALADLVDEAFDEVGSALPQVQQRALAGALVRDGAGDGTSARTTATAFVSVLAACAEKGAVLLAVDDIQWLDSASAQTLAFALRRLPPKVGVLLAHRGEAGQYLPLGLDRALPEGRLLRIAPRPLSLGRAPSPGEVPPRHVASAAASRAPGRRLRRKSLLRTRDGSCARATRRSRASAAFARPPQPRGAGGLAGRNLVAARTAARARRGRHLAADPVRPCIGASRGCRLRRSAPRGGGGGGADL